jgi:hypothetical protein
MALNILKLLASLVALHALFWILIALAYPRWFNAEFYQHKGDGVSRARGGLTLGAQIRLWSCIIGTVMIAVFASEAFLWWMPEAWGSYSEEGESLSVKYYLRGLSGLLSVGLFPLLTQRAEEIFEADQRIAAEERWRARQRDL